jgi:hypothetical protein
MMQRLNLQEQFRRGNACSHADCRATALYMPALVAIRHNPDLKAKYQALIKAGKPPKVALTALMRKLIELANAFIKADRNWVKSGLDQDGYAFDYFLRAIAPSLRDHQGTCRLARASAQLDS